MKSREEKEDEDGIDIGKQRTGDPRNNGRRQRESRQCYGRSVMTMGWMGWMYEDRRSDPRTAGIGKEQ